MIETHPQGCQCGERYKVEHRPESAAEARPQLAVQALTGELQDNNAMPGLLCALQQLVTGDAARDSTVGEAV